MKIKTIKLKTTIFVSSFGIVIALLALIGFVNPAQAAGGVTVDDASLTVSETPTEFKTTYVQIGGSVPVSYDNYSYSLDYSASNGCTASVDFNGPYTSTGNLINIIQGVENWTRSSILRIKGGDDATIGEGSKICTITYTLTTTHPGYNGDTATTTVTVTDDDAIPAIILTKTSGPSSLTESNPESVDNRITYSIKTSDYSTDFPDVTVTASEDCKIGIGGGKGGGLTLHQSTIITLSTGIRNFYVYPVDDSIVEGSHSCVISFSSSTSDPEYASLSVPSQTITIIDNDAAESSPTEMKKENSTTSTPVVTYVEPEQKELPVFIKSIDVNNKSREEFVKNKVQFGEPVTLKGTTVPNGVVKLYIFSEPQEATVTADDEGNWSYTIASIEPGDHRVEIEVTDPATGETSERSEVLAFSVAQAEETQDVAQVAEVDILPIEENSSLMPVIIIVVVLLAASAGGGYWFWRKKQHANVESQASTPADTAPQPTIVNEVADNSESKIDDNK